MPRPEEFTAADGFPLWDTVEVIFFFICGVTAGLALGFFFPSLWRSFRRVFRRLGGSKAQLVKLDVVPQELVILPEALLDAEEAEPPALSPQLEDTLVQARAWVQTGRLREAVVLYLEILRSLQISSRSTVRVFHELSQVYALLGMASKALDMAWEAYSRRPYLEQLLVHYLNLCQKFKSYSRIQEAQNVYRGSAGPALRFQFAHTLCGGGESLLEQGDRSQGILAIARQAQHWHKDSIRVHALMWWAPCLLARDFKTQGWVLWLQGALGWCRWLASQGAPGALVYGVGVPSPYWAPLAEADPQSGYAFLESLDKDGLGQTTAGPVMAHLLLHTVWRQPQFHPLMAWAQRWGRWGPWVEEQGQCQTLAIQRMGWCQCDSCGTVGQNPQWQCHRCGAWESARVPVLTP